MPKNNEESVLETQINRQNSVRPIVTVQGARIPPNATDIEELLIGAMLISPNLAGELNEFLQTEHFYDRRNATIYDVMQKLYLQNKPIDSGTVLNALNEEGKLSEVGGARRLADLSMLISSAANAKMHVQILIQKYMQRELIRLATEMQSEAYNADEDVEHLMQKAEDALYKLHEYKLRRDVQPLSMALTDVMNELETLRQNPDKFSGIPTGFEKLDLITQGWQKGDLIIIAARPSIGKTAFALSMARSMALEHKKKVAFFSIEMNISKIVHRLLSAESGINAKVLRSGHLTNPDSSQLIKAMNKLSKAEIFLDDTNPIGLGEIRAKSRRLKVQFGIDIIMIDYLQIISTPSQKNGNREQEVSKLSHGLKALAKELDVPVIALAQVNRSVDSRTENNNRPYLSDLRESGAIEQDADIVAFLNRPEKNGINNFQDNAPTTGRAELIVAKHRNGEVGSVFMSFDKDLARFRDDHDMVDHNDPNGETYSNSENSFYSREHVLESQSNSHDDFGDPTIETGEIPF